MKAEDIPSIQSIFSRIQEINKLTASLGATNRPAMTEGEKPEFARELDRTLQEMEKISTDPKKPELLQKTEPVERMRDRGQIFELDKIENQERAKTKDRVSGLESIIEKESKKKGIDPDLVRAIIKAESNYNPKAESPKGAMGLMQLMPSTAEDLGVDDPFDPVQNIKGGTSYLKDMLRIFKDKDLAVAAYNAGPGAVKKHKGIPPYQETQQYVKKVNKFLDKYK